MQNVNTLKPLKIGNNHDRKHYYNKVSELIKCYRPYEEKYNDTDKYMSSHFQ